MATDFYVYRFELVSMWRIQDFPGGTPNYPDQFFPENYMKMKTFWLGDVSGVPPRSDTELNCLTNGRIFFCDPLICSLNFTLDGLFTRERESKHQRTTRKDKKNEWQISKNIFARSEQALSCIHRGR